MGLQKFGHSLVRMLQSRAFCSRQVPAAKVPATQIPASEPFDAVSYIMITLTLGAPVLYYIMYWTDHKGIRTDIMAYKAAEKELKRRENNKDNDVRYHLTPSLLCQGELEY